LAAGRIDRRADCETNGAGALEPAPAWPEISSVVRARDDQLAGRLCQEHTTDAITSGLAGWHSRPFGKYDDPAALGQPLFADADDLVNRITSGFTIYRNRLARRQAPTEKRDQQQFPFQDPNLRGKQQNLHDGLICRRMLHQDDGTLCRQILEADDRIR
jgi:hypothetical protein